MKLQNQYSYYLQHALKFQLTANADEFEGQDFYNHKLFTKGAIWQLSGYADKELLIPMGENEIDGFIFNNGLTYANFDVLKLQIRPLLLKMDSILNPLTDWIYIAEPESFDTKESARSWCEIMFLDPLNLPFKAFEKVLSLHGDVFDLIEKGIAIDKNQ